MNLLVKYFPFFGLIGTLKYFLAIELKYRMFSMLGTERGINTHSRDVPLVVSLTTYRARYDKVFLCIESLLRQECKPDRLILWIDEADDNIPSNLARLTKRGLEIRRCRDIRSYKKIIYTLREFGDAVIVTADDDFFYPGSWLKDLMEEYQKLPEVIHCHRGHLMTYDESGLLKNYRDWEYESPGFVGPSIRLFPTGAGGVLYPPNSLHVDVVDESLFLSFCPTADDVWLKAMSMRKGVECKKVRPVSEVFTQIQGTQHTGLWKENVINNKNDEQIRNVFGRYGLLEEGCEYVRTQSRRGSSAEA